MEIGNRYIGRRFELSDGALRTVAIVNRTTSHVFQTQGDEFLIELDGPAGPRDDLNFAKSFDTLVAPRVTGICLTNSDLLVQKHELTELSSGGQRLTVDLRHEASGLEVQVRYELGADDPFMRKWLHVSAAGSQTPLVTRLEVERLTFVPPVPFDQPSLRPHPEGLSELWYAEPTLGQPLLADELFCGLEYPGGYNRCEHGTVVLRHFPGRRLDQPLVSKPAVLGVSQPGEVCQAFRNYLMPLATAYVRERRPIVGYSSWAHTNTGSNERRMLDCIDLLLGNLTEKHGLKLDYIEVDCGWADPDTLWEYDARKFPNDLTPLVKRMKPFGTRLGLWYAPTGAWNLQPHPRHGYEMVGPAEGTGKGGYCPAGPKHHEALKKVMTDYIDRHDMKIVIFDFFMGYCEAGDHGHLPGRPYALEAIINAHIDLIAALRQTREDLYVVDWEIAMYGFSPWLVMHVDAIWISWSDHPMATGIPSPLPQESWYITARDDMLFTEIRQLEGHGRFLPTPYPGWATDRFAMWDQHEPIMEQGMPVYYGHRSDNAMMGLCRGGLFWNLWIMPDLYTDPDWAFVASAFKWALGNVDVLADMRPLFGEPIKKIVYAYGNYANGKGIATVRNPFVREQRAEVPLDRSLGLAADDEAEYVARVVYPYHGYLAGTYRRGDRIPVQVPGYQTITLELVRRDDLAGPVPLGVRYTADGSKTVVHGEAGTEDFIRIVGPGGQEDQHHLAFGGQYEGLRVPVVRALRSGDGLLGLINVTIPDHYRDNMLLVLFESETPEQIYCQVEHYDEQTGSLTKPITERNARNATFGSNPHNMIHESYWVFFLCPMTTGEHHLHVQLSCVEKNRFNRRQWARPLRGFFSAWLWSRVPLASTDIDLPLAAAGDGSVPIPMTQDVDQRLVCLIPETYVNTKALANRQILTSS